jgi:hypothetical protein
MKAQFVPQADEITAVARQDVAVTRERLFEQSAPLWDYVARESVKAWVSLDASESFWDG